MGRLPDLRGVLLSIVLAVAVNVVAWWAAYRLISSRWRSPFAYFYGLCSLTLVMAAVLTSALGLPNQAFLLVSAAPLVLTVLVTLPAAKARGDARGEGRSGH